MTTLKTQIRRGTSAFVWRGIRRRHVAWGTAAAVLSVLLHLALFGFFPVFKLEFLRKDQVEAQMGPIKLKDVDVDTSKIEPDRRPPQFRPGSAEGKTAGDVGAEALSFRRNTDEAEVEPRPLGGGVLIGERRGLVEAEVSPAPKWEPRQDILKIQERVVRDEVSALPRRFVDDIPRVQNGMDIVSPAERPDSDVLTGGTNAYYLTGDPGQFAWGKPVTGPGGGGGGAPATNVPVAVPEPPPKLFTPEERATTLKALEKLLKADVYVYAPARDSNYAYCRIEISRRGPDVLPVLPKDMLFVQDASASITEQKLHFCRLGMARALDALGASDRFNVVEFRNEPRFCFKEWAEVNPDTLQRAYEFIARMKSEGDTDIFGAMREFLKLPRRSGRPLIVMAVSDGVATVGLTDRSLIIEAFSQANRGAVSVFTVGTYAGANAYLLDLLSYRNRGDTFIVKSGRWDIPNVVEQRSREVRHPVLSDVRFRFGGQTYCEAYPVLTANLFMDRPLVLFGRYPRRASQLVFQATGQADDIQCDMVFDIDLSRAKEGDKEIATNWAWQKVYHLIGEHNRTRSPETLDEIKRIGKTFGIRIPYRRELSD